MSQVIVTDDSLKAKREASGSQERRIANEDLFSRWRRNDITRKDPVLTMIGIAAAPVLALWSLFTGAMLLIRSNLDK